MTNNPIQGLPGEAFLNKYWIDETVRKMMEPLLYFNGKLPITNSTEKSFIYEVMENTATADLEDGIMSLPLPGGEEAALTRLNMSNISEVKARIPKVGYKIPLTRDLLSKTTVENELNIRMGKAAWGMAYYLNKLTIDTMVAGARASTYNIPYVWDSATGKQNPPADLVKMWFEYKNKGFPNRARDIFFEDSNMEDLVLELQNRDIKFVLDGNTLKVPEYPQLANMTFYNVEDQLTTGTSLTMDLSGGAVYPGAEIYRYIDQNFAVTPANPEQTEPADPTGIHVNIVTETQNPFTTFVEVWMHPLPVVKIDDLIMAQTGH
jgi:hypothetical protein